MLRPGRLTLLTLWGVAACAAPAAAEVVIRLPFVTLTIGGHWPGPLPPGPVPIRPVRGAPTPPLLTPVRLQLPPPLVPVAPAATPPVMRPMTHQEFAAAFTPAPGTYEVLLIHPG